MLFAIAIGMFIVAIVVGAFGVALAKRIGRTENVGTERVAVAA